MAVRQPRYTKEEHARIGTTLYEQQVRPLVEADHQGQIVAIDVDTGAFEVATDTLSAADRLLARCPDAQIWFVRVGHRGVHRFGSSTNGGRMITGSVNADHEAILSLVVLGTAAGRAQVDAVIDTGFSGHLTLQPALIANLQLTWLGREQGTLADGSVELFDVYRAAVMWDGQPRFIEVEAVRSQPLVGMALLANHSLQIDVVVGGPVVITALP